MVLERDGGLGGGDLHVSTRPTIDDPWGAPEPIVELNTPDDEVSGRFVLGGLGIVFCSNRNRQNWHDIYFAERTSLSEPFSIPQPLEGINSSFEDYDAWPSEDMRYIVFGSNRSGTPLLYEASR